MGKLSSFVLGVLLLGFGIANFFLPAVRLPATQAVIHIVLGLAGLIAAYRYTGKGFLRVFAAFSLLFAALGFLGLPGISDLIALPLYLYWIYFILGLLAVWIYITLIQADRIREARSREESI